MKFDDEDEFGKCPYCKGANDECGMPMGTLMIIRDWVNLHTKETLLHCWDCDRSYIAKYKLVKVVELIEKEIESWDIDEK